MTRATGLALYDATASVAASPVIRKYSTSFRLATSLFPRRCRSSIDAIYALVRIADEIVDGTAAEAGLNTAEQAELLDALEAETERAVARGFSANLVVHAYAQVARACGIDTELSRAFFRSMRRDLHPVDFTEDELRDYIYGSAEVVGLMCLRVFLRDQPCDTDMAAALDEGASRLGSAFQKVNFLRDLGDDQARLGRAYFPGVRDLRITEEQKAAAIADIRADLAAATAATALLPRDCRRAVRVATGLFANLLRRIERTPAETLPSTRVSVPAPVKLALTVRASLAPGRLAR